LQEHKVIAAHPYAGASVAGMDTSPLLHSAVRLSGPGATTDDRDDIVIRKEMELLPSGYYGAVFTGVNLRDVAETAGVKLNFTMIYRGGPRYKALKGDGSTTPPEPFTRMGMGLRGYRHQYNSTDGLFASLQNALVGNMQIDVRFLARSRPSCDRCSSYPFLNQNSAQSVHAFPSARRQRFAASDVLPIAG